MRALTEPPRLTIQGFHMEAESQVLVTVQQPAITGCRDVQHQPALVSCSEGLKIQKEQVRLPVDTKEQLTKGRGPVPLPLGTLIEAATLPWSWAGLLCCMPLIRHPKLCAHVKVGD